MSNLSYQYGFGKVTGGFALAVGDAYDLDRNPDAKPAEGTVTFRPQVSRIVIPGERIVTPAPIECSLDAGGYLYLPSSVTPGEDGTVPAEDQGVYLVANDTTDASPTGWTYEVTVALNGQAQWKFSIAVTTDSAQDISALVPVDSDGGTPVLRGPRGVGIESITDTDGDGTATVTYTDTTTSDLPLPQGQKGDPGKDGTQLVSYDQIDTLPDYPATFPPATHTHPIGQVDGLQGALDGKQAAGDYATVSQLPTTPGDIGAATAAQGALADTAVQEVTAGSGISVDTTTPTAPVIAATGDPDTGPVTLQPHADIAALVDPAQTELTIQRVGPLVQVSLAITLTPATDVRGSMLATIPTGYRPAASLAPVGVAYNATTQVAAFFGYEAGDIGLMTTTIEQQGRLVVSAVWLTSDPWPA